MLVPMDTALKSEQVFAYHCGLLHAPGRDASLSALLGFNRGLFHESRTLSAGRTSVAHISICSYVCIKSI